MGCDTHLKLLGSTVDVFQSTQPEWAATEKLAERAVNSRHFNPRSPNGLRPRQIFLMLSAANFNPRSPNGLRQTLILRSGNASNFNPRSPNGLRPKSQCAELILLTISIHAARMGCDFRMNHCSNKNYLRFQSTQPEWAATKNSRNVLLTAVISIHAARMGCDESYPRASAACNCISIHAARMGCDRYGRNFKRRQLRDFNPRSPNGLRHRQYFI